MDFLTGFLFNGLSTEQREKIVGVSSEVQVEEGQSVFTEDHDARFAYVLKSAHVELMSKIYEDFCLPVSMLRNPGEIFGSSALTPPYRYSLSSRCARSGRLIRLDRIELQDLMAEDKALASILNANLASFFLDKLKETRHQIKIHFKILLGSTRS